MRQNYRCEVLTTRPRHVYTYYATGRSAFPMDMLRYDEAWPVDVSDAAKLTRDGVDREEWRATRSVKLCSYKEPTVERWLSFGWSIGIDDLGRLFHGK